MQVVLDHEIPSMQLIEIKSALISALSSNGQISDALNIYDEIKQAKCSIDPKAIISLIVCITNTIFSLIYYIFTLRK